MEHDGFIPLKYSSPDQNEQEAASALFLKEMETRRSVREFASEDISSSVIENILKTAGTAPSGANKQPWSFCAVHDPKVKQQIREAAEKEEHTNYHGRMSERWLQDLQPLGTDHHKPFLETAPWLIVVFKKVYGIDESGEKDNHYYVNESVGIATGMLITAIHKAGLCTLTHTPSPMNFLEKLLKRPKNERAYMLLPVGKPAENAKVPNISRKPVDKFIDWY